MEFSIHKLSKGSSHYRFCIYQSPLHGICSVLKYCHPPLLAYLPSQARAILFLVLTVVSKIQGLRFLVISVQTYKSDLTVIRKPLAMLFSL